MSRNKHSKTRRNQNGDQRTSTGPRKQQGRTGTTSTGAIPSEMRSSGGQQSESGSSLGSSLESARGTAMSFAGNALESIKKNPMPYALAGIGVACAGAGLTWLLVSASKHAFDEEGNALDFQHRIQASMKGATKSMQGSMQGATKSMRRVSEAAGARVSQLTSEAKRIEQSVEDVVREHPIAVGAALLATGAAIAMAIPRSALEDTWLGRERDQVVSSAQKLAQGAVQKAQTFAKQVSSKTSNGTANAHT
jgi:hypothetical protein